MKYKTIFIDWHGTLSNSRFWDRWAKDIDKQHLHQQAQYALFEDAEGLLILKDWMRGLRSVNNVISYLHEATGIPAAELEDELRYTSENMAFINHDVVDRIETLRSMGAKVLIASDNMDTFRLWTIPALGLEGLFDGILTSERRGALKSEVNEDGFSPFFSLYLRQNNIQPGEAVLIDDNQELKLVESLGIDFLHVNAVADLVHHLDDLIQTNQGVV
jgi:FMN phosphatase YigB (HAD superfamily)